MIALALLLFGEAALAGEATPCGNCSRCAERSCSEVRIEHPCLSPQPLCKPPRHHAVTPALSCSCPSPVRLCHKPILPEIPCAPCIEERRVCHKPATAVLPQVECPVQLELTGSPDLIQGDCECTECTAEGHRH
jgi:hypothetical protein